MPIIDTDDYKAKLEPILKRVTKCADDLRELRDSIDDDLDLMDNVKERLEEVIDMISEQY